MSVLIGFVAGGIVRVLVFTECGDSHAKIVAAGLAKRGASASLWYGADLAHRQTLSWEQQGNGPPTVEVRGGSDPVAGPWDRVWYRRPNQPQVPADLQAGDRIFAQREWARCIPGVCATVAPEAFWVNARAAAEQATSKLVQLVEAARVGLSTPPTLISSDPQRIRAFLRDTDGETIYKPFIPGRWVDGDQTHSAFTAVVDADSLPDDDLLRACPGIFQQRLAKDHELRVTFVGRRAFVARLASQAVDEGRLDWRAAGSRVEVEAGTLPAEVEARCLALMDRLGLVFAAFDFVVTPGGEHVFLELNQAGQFLFVELAEPRLLLLDAFCELLLQGRPDYDWRPGPGALRFADLRDDARFTALDADHVAEPYPALPD